MAEKFITPPMRKPVSEFHTPSPTVTFFTELVARDDAAYVQNAPVKRGTLYATMIGADPVKAAAYPNLYFLRERKFQLSDQLVFWDWTTEEEAENTYNAEIDYVANNVLYPAFTRVYMIRRDEYEAAPTKQIGSTLTALIGVTIEDPGQNYSSATGTIPGKGVEIQFVVSEGQIISGVVTKEGTGVLATDTIVVNGDGAGATIIPIVQPTTCYLTSQKKQEIGQDDPLGNEFVRVIRTYETLPGPFIATTRFDKDGAIVTVNTRRNITANITDTDVISGGIWTQTWHKGSDSFVSEETVETRSVPGNAITSTKVDDDGKILTTVRQLVETSAVVSSESIVGGVWIRKFGTEVDDSSLVKVHQASNKVSYQVTLSRPVPGNAMTKTVIDSSGDIMTETRTMVVGPPTLVTINTIVGNVWTKTFGEPISDLVSWKVVQVRTTQNPMFSYEVSIPDLIPEEFRAKLPIITGEETLIGTAALPSLPLPLGFLYAKEEQIDDYTYRLITKYRNVTSLPKVITNKEITSQFGGGDVSVTLTLDLFNNLPLDEGLTVLTSEVKHLDDALNGLAIKTSKILDDGEWPVLDGTHVDEKYDLIIGIQRQTVGAGTTGGVDVDGTIREVRSHDKWKSVQIASKLDVDSLPEDVQWFSGMQRSFPPELVVVPWVEPVIDWAEATCGCSESFSAVLIANLNQYSGEVKTRVTEQFYNGPPPDDVTITQFFPETHHFGFAWSSFCGDSDGNCRTKSGAPEFHIPLCLHDDFTVCIGHPALHCADTSLLWNFPATSPATLPHGTYVMLRPHVERWRFGVFRRVLIEVLVP